MTAARTLIVPSAVALAFALSFAILPASSANAGAPGGTPDGDATAEAPPRVPSPAVQPHPDDPPAELPRLGTPGGGTGFGDGSDLPAFDGPSSGPNRRSGPLARPLFLALVGMKHRIGTGFGGPEAEQVCRLVMADGVLDDIEADLIGELTDLRISYGRPWRRELKVTAAPLPDWAPQPEKLIVMVIAAGWQKLLECTGIEPPPERPAAAQQTEEDLAASIEASAGPDTLVPLARDGGESAGRLGAAFHRVLLKSWQADGRAAPASALRMQLGRIYARGAALQGAAKEEWRALLHGAARALDETEKGAVPDDAYSWLAPAP